MKADLGELVSLLSTGINHAAVYREDHPRVREAAEEFARRLEDSLAEAQEDGLFLGMVEGRLVSDGRPLLGPTLIAKRLIDAATRLHSGGFLFHRGIQAPEVTRFFGLCTRRVRGASSLDECRRLMASHEIRDIAPSPLYGEPGWLGDNWGQLKGGRATIQVSPGTIQGAIPAYQGMLEAVEGVHAAAHDDREVDAVACRGIAEGLMGSLAERPSDLMHLSRYPDYDSYTLGHSVRVAILATLVAQHLKYPPEMLVEIGTAALLHDAGKGKIPREILYKRGPLDNEERRVMSTHSVLGAEVLLRSPDTGPLSIAAAYGHHLRYDRRGYPAVGRWARSSKITSLIQMCDMFEALTAVRPYKPCLTPHRAYEIILEDPGAFDPAAFAALFRAVGLYPPGTRVLLDSGEEAFVLKTGGDPRRPLVQLTHGPDGRPLVESDRRTLDLGSEDARHLAVTRMLLDDVRDVVAEPSAYAERPLTVVTQNGTGSGPGSAHKDTCAH